MVAESLVRYTLGLMTGMFVGGIRAQQRRVQE